MKNNTIFKRFILLFMAAVIAMTSIPIPAAAKEKSGNKATMVMRYNLFQNKEFTLYGHTHRSMTYYMVGMEDGSVPAFCLQPGRRLPNFTQSEYELYPVDPAQSVPVVGSFERYLPMTLAYEWMLENYYDPPRYAVVQTYLWGCMAGAQLDWNTQKPVMERLSAVMKEPRILSLYEELKEYVKDGVQDYYSTENTSLPGWNGTQQRMELKEGIYELTLDISSCPQLQETVWSFPETGWSYQLSSGGESITFRYQGNGTPSGTICSGELSGIDTRFFAYIFQPPEPFQMQMGWLDMNRPPAVVSFSLGDTPGVNLPDSPGVELYRHSEVFEADYKIDLEKYCGETDQRLEGASFQVWEGFDLDQICTEDYIEGEPDGLFGEVYANCMSPEPEEYFLCDIMTTDQNGYASHSDFKNYNYNKTYCMGHPAPEWIQCDHEKEEKEGEGSEEEECGCEEENERLRQQWQAEQELCSSTCDFHVQNENEDNHSQDPSAREEMLADRDATYENFIALEYSYTLKEQNARAGYILHGKHRDDQPIETVTLTSAQDGGRIREADAIREMSAALISESRSYRDRRSLAGVKKWLTQTLPEGVERILDELREIVEIKTEELEDLPEKEEGVDGDKKPGADDFVEEEKPGSGEGMEGDETDDPDDSETSGAGEGETGTNPEKPGTGDGSDGEEPDKPDDSGNSDKPGTGESETETNPEKPGTGEGADSEKPGKPEKPGNSGNPGSEEDETGTNPEKPGTGEGTDSEKPGKPDKPDNPGNSDNPEPAKGETGANSRNAGSLESGKERESVSDSSAPKTGADTDRQEMDDSTPRSEAEQAGADSSSPKARESSKNKELKTDPDRQPKTPPESEHNADKSDSTAPAPAESANKKDSKETPITDPGKASSGADPASTQLTSAHFSPQASITRRKIGLRLSAHKATPSTPSNIFRDDPSGCETEFYQYTRQALEPSADDLSSPWLPSSSEPSPRIFDLNRMRESFSRLLKSEDGSITLSLPDFIDDTEPSMDTSGYGNPGDILYTFKIWNHRTEGRLHINKRDLELGQLAPEASGGQTQGDATLEGAVYGLFAAQDIIHPDGKSGVIYQKHDLTAIAATDREGNASFLAYTEVPGTTLGADGTVQMPQNSSAPENLYNGSSISSSSEGFGTITYPDYEGKNGNSWIGRPLLMGSYYIRELSRSEGYELSVYGKTQPDTNQTAKTDTIPEAQGTARVKYGLSENNSMEADGTWNEFVIEHQGTEQGYDITLTGYPEGTRIFRQKIRQKTEKTSTITGTRKEIKKDSFGNTVYQTAAGGEYKIGPDGNPMERPWTEGDTRIPAGEAYPYRFRTSPQLTGNALPEDLSKWDLPVDGDYLKAQVNSMLRQLGCQPAEPEQGAPWINLELTGSLNSQAAAQILDWFTAHGFYDQGITDEVYQQDGIWYARLYYDSTSGNEACPAVYDSASRSLYIRKTGTLEGGQAFHYWISKAQGEFRLESRLAQVMEKQEITGEVRVEEDLEARLETIYQPMYETYRPGEVLLDRNGNPIPVMEEVPVYKEIEISVDELELIPVEARYDREQGAYSIHEEILSDGETSYRAVTDRSTITYEGKTIPYSQYLTQVGGASVYAFVTEPETDPDSYIRFARLEYPGQDIPVQDGSTGVRPMVLHERVIRQPIRVTKDIAKSSYDGVNTYGSVHNDAMTNFLGLFTGGREHKGTGQVSHFRFKLYLKQNLEHLYADEHGGLISRYTGRPEFKDQTQVVFQPPEGPVGWPLLEKKEDGTPDYKKFFSALYAAKALEEGNRQRLKEFVLEYDSIEVRKKEILQKNPHLNSDQAYALALVQAMEEGEQYLKPFKGLDSILSVQWDSEPEGGADKDKTTLQCNTKYGSDHYYASSVPLPYGTYVMTEQVPQSDEFANRHYQIRDPEEVVLPFVPSNAGGEMDYTAGDPYFRYNSKDTPEELIRKYKIRFNEETHIIEANGQNGSFQIYKYGLCPDARPGHSLTSKEPYETEYMDGRNPEIAAIYQGYSSQSEEKGLADQVRYEGNETESGETELRDQVPVMSGIGMAIHGKYAPMLVPWSVTEPAPGEEGRYKAYAHKDVENTYYRSRLRIEKLDAETGDNILHDGALFKIYAAKRDVKKEENGTITGTGAVLFGPAVDAEGNPVTDMDGRQILYPRVGASNSSGDDLPIRLDQEGIPLYDESQLISQKDTSGNETGIFRAFSTEQEILADGEVKKEVTGFIETYEPLGAGAYVLVEIDAPRGYTKSRPVAFEIYGDEVTYYEELNQPDGTHQGWEQKPAGRYQYALPLEEGNIQKTETVSRIPVKDHPSRVQIHKVEDGDSLIGNENGLLEKDSQGRTEASGGFSSKVMVNDTGDGLIYQVWGREEKLKERGDVRDIRYDEESERWTGFVTKAMDRWSEEIIEGTEKELRSMAGVKPLYHMDGTFSGKGIRFGISVSRAGLAPYEGIQLEPAASGGYTGVKPIWENGKITQIINENTGIHKELAVTGHTNPAFQTAGHKIWDAVPVKNPPVSLYFYDLSSVPNRREEETGRLQILDDGGNFLCYADETTGMAYVYDEFGRMIAYVTDETNGKKLVRSIQVTEQEKGRSIYQKKQTEDDENSLPVSYTSWEMTEKEETWVTGQSTGPDGSQETVGGVHEIARLPFGAYILQEEDVPYDQGYIQSAYQGMILEDTDQVQKYFLQNVFTRAAFAKIDVRTQKEIVGAGMTLYQARLDEKGDPVTDREGRYQKGEVYHTWISGYAYDDRGNLKTDGEGNPVLTMEPHWIDHIPVGPYVLEETSCPYDQGYVQSNTVNIDILETGQVQSFEMEDDFTALDIKKADAKTGEILYEDSPAILSLYRAAADENGNPVYKEEDLLLTFRAATYQDGQAVAATGRYEPDSSGNRPIMKYDYQYQEIPGTKQGRFYYTEQGSVRMEYLPVGYYVLAEKENPDGYATADPIFIYIEDKGHLEEIQYSRMEDEPLRVQVSKTAAAGGKEIAGAKLAIYPVKEDGKPEEHPLILHIPVENGAYEDREAVWISGLDGVYTQEDQELGRIPEGFLPGDLRPHLVEYIPEGEYILREEMTPYGFLQSVDVPFSIVDTQVVQKAEMVDEIPAGRLELVKHDADDTAQTLQGAWFRLENKTQGTLWAEAVTDEQGRLAFSGMPIGYLDNQGKFSPYTYLCTEFQAAPGHMLTLKPFEFQFEYQDEHTKTIVLPYDPVNDSNRVVVEKRLGATEELLEGALLRLERKAEGQDIWELAEEWISGKQPHMIRALEAGEYRLREIQAPEGFTLLEEPFYFIVQDGMTEIPQLVMRNYASIVGVEKVNGTTGVLLGGARLELIRKSDGTVIRQWTSEEGMGQTFYGLEPGIYIIRELEAPEGYEKAPDKEIEITGDQSAVQKFTFENTKITSSGGGGGGKPKPDYISFKKTDMSGRPLEGAEFTFYDQKGEVMAAAVSRADGSLRIAKPEDGTYTFRETKAPEGYALNPDTFTFTIRGKELITGTYEIKNEELKVVLKKEDGMTRELLSGARLQVIPTDGEGEILEGVTGEDGTLTLRLLKPGAYLVREMEAPEGYQRTGQEYHFTVHPDGTIQGNTTIINFKQERRLGIITAWYRPRPLSGQGHLTGEGGDRTILATGDEQPVYELAALGAVSMAGLFLCFLRMKKRKAGKWFLAVILALFTIFGSTRRTWASEFQESEMVYVEKELNYPGVEDSFQPPASAGFTIQNHMTGREQKVFLPIIKAYDLNQRWEEGFRLELDSGILDGDYYLLGDRAVDRETFLSEEGLRSCEADILKTAGLPSEGYRIRKVERDGRAIICTGEKRVRDCRAVYGGYVGLEKEGESRTAIGEGDVSAVPTYYDGNRGIYVLILGGILLLGIAWGLMSRPKLIPVFICLFASGVFLSAGSLAGMAEGYRKEARQYEVLREQTFSQEEVKAEESRISTPPPGGPASIDEKELRAANPDYQFWIRIPGTEVDYPVVQRPDDREYYLTRDFYGRESSAGSIFAEEGKLLEEGVNTVLYGHNRRDGSMFGGLKAFLDPDYRKAHPDLYLYYQGAWFRCPIRLAQVRPGEDKTLYQQEISGRVTLSTCHGQGQRMILQADLPEGFK